MNEISEKPVAFARANGTVAHDSGHSPAPASPWAALLSSSDGATPEYKYDSEVDIAIFRVKGHAQIVESDDSLPGVVVDLDAEGRTVGIEIFDFARVAANLGFSRIVASTPVNYPLENGNP